MYVDPKADLMSLYNSGDMPEHPDFFLRQVGPERILPQNSSDCRRI